MDIKTKNKFKDQEELLSTFGYFWKWERYQNQYKLDKSSKIVKLINTNINKVVAKGLKGINRFMQLENLGVEE